MPRIERDQILWAADEVLPSSPGDRSIRLKRTTDSGTNVQMDAADVNVLRWYVPTGIYKGGYSRESGESWVADRTVIDDVAGLAKVFDIAAIDADIDDTLVVGTFTEIKTTDTTGFQYVKTKAHGNHMTKGGALYRLTGQSGSAGTGDEVVVYDSAGNELQLDTKAPDIFMMGMVADRVTDDSASLQRFLNFFTYIYVPNNHAIRYTVPIYVKLENTTIVADKERNAQMGAAVDSFPLQGFGVMFADGATAGLVFDNAFQVNGFVTRHITYLGAGSGNTNHFTWHNTGLAFLRNFTFYHCTIVKSAKAFTVKADIGQMSQIGVLHIKNCNVMFNRRIIDCVGSTRINGLLYVGNDSGNNGWAEGDGGIIAAGNPLVINDNVLEGTREPIFIKGSLGGLEILNNYIETDTGEYSIKIEEVTGEYRVNNFYSNMGSKNTVVISHSDTPITAQPYTPKGATGGKYPKWNLSDDLGCLVDQSSSSLLHSWLGEPSIEMLNRPGSIVTEAGATQGAVSIENPLNKGRIIQGYAHTTGPTNSTKSVNNTTNISVSAGHWVCMTFYIKRDIINSIYSTHIAISGANNGTLSEAYFGKAKRWLGNNKICCVFIAARCTLAETAVTQVVFPYGTTALANATSVITYPYVYTVSDIRHAYPYPNYLNLLPEYADDAAAATGGVPVSGPYRTGNIQKIRIA